MKNSVRRYIREHNLLQNSDSVVVGVSGGVDSMSLLHVLCELGYETFAVHFDHGLRGAESRADLVCVSDYCTERDISFMSVSLGSELKNRSGSGSIQAHARHLRYLNLHRISTARGIHHVAVAHNRNDQAETVLLNLKRGTGLDGMAGMRPARELRVADEQNRPQSHNLSRLTDAIGQVHLIRPLLRIRRRELETYVRIHDIPWRDDSSNRDLRYLRNRIRHEIIPEVMHGDGPDFIDDIAEAAEAVAGVVDDVFPRSLPGPLLNWHNLDRRLPIDPLMSLCTVLRSWLYLRALRYWLPAAPARSTTIAAIESLLKSQPGRRLQFESGCVWRERSAIYFEQKKRAGTPKDDYFIKSDTDLGSGSVPLAPGNPVQIDDQYLVMDFNGHGQVKNIRKTAGQDSFRVFLDFAKVIGPLRVRRWKAGDRFVPLGMTGTKKVKSYLTDIKVESSIRREMRVVIDDEKIIWLVGHRLDDRVRLEKDTKIVARLSVGTKPVK